VTTPPVADPPGPSAPPPSPPENYCPRCGTPFAEEQEYCLECGLRLPVRTGFVASLGNAWRRRVGWYPGDWMWPSLLALVIAALGAGGAIYVTNDDGKAADTVIATTATTDVTTTQPTAPEQPTTATTTTAPKPKPKPKPKNALTPWPPRAGWTVILASVPLGSRRATAVAQARRALAAGLEQVGVLVSSRFSTLHPGYYVVFSGIYSAEADATSAVADAHTHGYASAYATRVAR
jgi:hypothetical protein